MRSSERPKLCRREFVIRYLALREEWYDGEDCENEEEGGGGGVDDTLS